MSMPASSTGATAVAGRSPLLEIDNLSVTFKRRGSQTRAVDGVSYGVAPGEIVGVVGESGSGKSVTVLALMGLLPDRGVEVTGQVRYNGRDLLSLTDSAMAKLRGSEIAMVFQDPISSLNPVVPIGVQVSEVLLTHTRTTRKAAMDESVDLLRRCGIPDPGRRLKEYPHQLSGGMRQRALIAMALACKPKLLICDEPTTALDVTIQAQVLELLRELVTDSGTAMIMITHDLGVVAGLCDHVNVLYSGRIVESAPVVSCSPTPGTATPTACWPRSRGWIRLAASPCARFRAPRATPFRGPRPAPSRRAAGTLPTSASGPTFRWRRCPTRPPTTPSAASIPRR